jgi:hypothetical protein
MSEVVFGEIDWNEGAVSEGKSDFMKLEPGSKNRVRVMANPIQFFTHWLDLPNGKKKKINSPVSDPKLVQKLINEGFKSQPRWFIKVLDRTDGQFKLLEIGSQIFNGIKELYADDDWGPVTSYDITIKRGQPGEQPLYSVTPIPKSALDPSLKDSFIAFNDRVDVSKFIQPADPDSVRAEMGWGTSKKPAAAAKSTASDAFGTSKGGEDDDDIFNFED